MRTVDKAAIISTTAGVIILLLLCAWVALGQAAYDIPKIGIRIAIAFILWGVFLYFAAGDEKKAVEE